MMIVLVKHQPVIMVRLSNPDAIYQHVAFQQRLFNNAHRFH